MSICLRTSWKRLPRVVRRRMIEWVASVSCAIGLAIALVFTARRLSGIHPVLRGALTGVLPFVPHLIVQLRLTRAMRRWRREFAESNARLCTRCAHSLAGLADRGVCPECGGVFDIELDRASWRAVGVELPAKLSVAPPASMPPPIDRREESCSLASDVAAR